MEDPKKCVYCGVESHEIPLVALTYREQNYFICPEHIPVLIHEPGKLAGKLPGAEKLKGHIH